MGSDLSFVTIKRSTLIACFCATLLPISGWGRPSYEQAPIDYSNHQASDEVYRYFSQTQNLEGWSDEEASGYLTDFLAAFDIPIESQVLVFSKTSLQASRIGPANPRAIYFNDDLYIAWVSGGKMLEITAPSSHVGTNFYSLDRVGGLPQLERETDRCLRCHGDTFTRDVPGLFVRSVFPDETGKPMLEEVNLRSKPIQSRN